MRTTINFLVGALMGALVGATVAVLLAPSSGDELRQQIRERGLAFRDEIAEAASARRIELEKQLKSLRQPVSTQGEN
jgi:gas vesicle protein